VAAHRLPSEKHEGDGESPQREPEGRAVGKPELLEPVRQRVARLRPRVAGERTEGGNQVPREKLDQFMDFAYGRMKKKLFAAKEALDGGVPKVVIASSQLTDPVERALSGQGTVLT